MATSKRYGVRLKYSRDIELITFLDSLAANDDCSEWIRNALRIVFEQQKQAKTSRNEPPAAHPTPVIVQTAEETPAAPEVVEEVPSVDDINAKLDSFGSSF